MWQETGYEAQMKQLKEAGLNPALMYKGTGAGGMTVGTQGGHIGGAAAPQGGMEIMNATMMAAQIELMKAQTAKTQVETTKTAGVDTELGKTQISSLLQGISESKTKQALTEVETSIASIRETVAGATQNMEIAQIMYALEILQNDKTISNETKQAKINQIKSESIGAALDNIQKRAQTANIRQDTKLKWQEIQHTLTKMRSLNANIENIDNLNQIMQEANRLKEQANDLNDPNLTPQLPSFISTIIRGGK